jgi:hypothetical protein
MSDRGVKLELLSISLESLNPWSLESFMDHSTFFGDDPELFIFDTEFFIVILSHKHMMIYLARIFHEISWLTTKEESNAGNYPCQQRP